jgi:hypothetical protein
MVKQQTSEHIGVEHKAPSIFNSALHRRQTASVV